MKMPILLRLDINIGDIEIEEHEGSYEDMTRLDINIGDIEIKLNLHYFFK